MQSDADEGRTNGCDVEGSEDPASRVHERVNTAWGVGIPGVWVKGSKKKLRLSDRDGAYE